MNAFQILSSWIHEDVTRVDGFHALYLLIRLYNPNFHLSSDTTICIVPDRMLDQVWLATFTEDDANLFLKAHTFKADIDVCGPFKVYKSLDGTSRIVGHDKVDDSNVIGTHRIAPNLKLIILDKDLEIDL